MRRRYFLGQPHQKLIRYRKSEIHEKRQKPCCEKGQKPDIHKTNLNTLIGLPLLWYCVSSK